VATAVLTAGIFRIKVVEFQGRIVKIPAMRRKRWGIRGRRTQRHDHIDALLRAAARTGLVWRIALGW
jgi:hypothetical protein